MGQIPLELSADQNAHVHKKLQVPQLCESAQLDHAYPCTDTAELLCILSRLNQQEQKYPEVNCVSSAYTAWHFTKNQVFLP